MKLFLFFAVIFSIFLPNRETIPLEADLGPPAFALALPSWLTLCPTTVTGLFWQGPRQRSWDYVQGCCPQKGEGCFGCISKGRVLKSQPVSPSAGLVTASFQNIAWLHDIKRSPVQSSPYVLPLSPYTPRKDERWVSCRKMCFPLPAQSHWCCHSAQQCHAQRACSTLLLAEVIHISPEFNIIHLEDCEGWMKASAEGCISSADSSSGEKSLCSAPDQG